MKNKSQKSKSIEIWSKLLNEERRKPSGAQKTESRNKKETRTEIERDYDRILFSTPVRRLADKTQVFPLDKNDSVRNRLTHSHEVSNIARSIGINLAFNCKFAEGVENYQRNIPALLAAAGLVHDLGNPPFGHQGEAAIQSWFKKNRSFVLDIECKCKDSPILNEQQKQDFLRFEGNAQAFRLVTRLQLVNDSYGLDLTYATLAAMMKYPTRSNEIDKNHVSKKKHGFFASEEYIVKEVYEKVKLDFGKRHAFAYLVEACDDIAYAVIDAEDSVKKGLTSFFDLMDHLSTSEDKLIKRITKQSREKYEKYKREKLSPAELNDISMQRFRVFAIGEMIQSVTKTFRTKNLELLEGRLESSLLGNSNASDLCSRLKEFSLSHAYKHRSVLEIELKGFNAINELMNFFWSAIVDREDGNGLESPRKHPFTRYVYQRISENYRRVFENPTNEDKDLPVRYRECLLLTDMISGMTDSFAISLCEELNALKGDFNPYLYLKKDT